MGWLSPRPSDPLEPAQRLDGLLPLRDYNTQTLWPHDHLCPPRQTPVAPWQRATLGALLRYREPVT